MNISIQHFLEKGIEKLKEEAGRSLVWLRGHGNLIIRRKNMLAVNCVFGVGMSLEK